MDDPDYLKCQNRNCNNCQICQKKEKQLCAHCSKCQIPLSISYMTTTDKLIIYFRNYVMFDPIVIPRNLTRREIDFSDKDRYDFYSKKVLQLSINSNKFERVAEVEEDKYYFLVEDKDEQSYSIRIANLKFTSDSLKNQAKLGRISSTDEQKNHINPKHRELTLDSPEFLQIEKKCTMLSTIELAVSPSDLEFVMYGNIIRPFRVIIILNNTCEIKNMFEINKERLRAVTTSFMFMTITQVFTFFIIYILNYKDLLDSLVLLARQPSDDVGDQISRFSLFNCEKSARKISLDADFEITNKIRKLFGLTSLLDHQKISEIQDLKMYHTSKEMKNLKSCSGKFLSMEGIVYIIFAITLLIRLGASLWTRFRCRRKRQCKGNSSKAVEEIHNAFVSQKVKKNLIFLKLIELAKKIQFFNFLLVFFDNLNQICIEVIFAKTGAFGIDNFCICVFRSFVLSYTCLLLLENDQVEQEKFEAKEKKQQNKESKEESKEGCGKEKKRKEKLRKRLLFQKKTTFQKLQKTKMRKKDSGMRQPKTSHFVISKFI